MWRRHEGRAVRRRCSRTTTKRALFAAVPPMAKHLLWPRTAETPSLGNKNRIPEEARPITTGTTPRERRPRKRKVGLPKKTPFKYGMRWEKETKVNWGNWCGKATKEEQRLNSQWHWTKYGLRLNRRNEEDVALWRKKWVGGVRGWRRAWLKASRVQRWNGDCCGTCRPLYTKVWNRNKLSNCCIYSTKIGRSFIVIRNTYMYYLFVEWKNEKILYIPVCHVYLCFKYILLYIFYMFYLGIILQLRSYTVAIFYILIPIWKLFGSGVYL